MTTDKWVSCPECGSHNVSTTVSSSNDEPEVELSCTDCRAKVSNLTDDDQDAMRKWLACPSCDSHDINIEVSLPFGYVGWTCDDCLYDPGRPQTQDENGVWRPE
ncbi:hypothetical protein [Natrinema sp. 74]|uniref:hypothetical protein n=1 Tax=Natrinema sp. 74 TaxID=3384159 RepID=UPI0038D3F634